MHGEMLAVMALVGIVVIVSALLSGAVEKIGLPHVAIFLGLGAVLGPAGFGLLDIGLQDPTLQVIATLALVLVLFSDAISVDVGEIRAHRRLAFIVLGPVTLIPAVLITLAAWALLDVPPLAAAILGAALASTDPVLLRTLLRKPELPREARMALRLESGMNDAVLLPIVVISMIALLSGGKPGTPALAETLLGLFILGPALGAIIGYVSIRILEVVRARIGVRRDYESIYALGIALSAFAAAEAVGGSGFLAAFAAGLVIALVDVELCDCFLDYGEATAEMFLILAFVAFGASIIWQGLDVISVRTVLFAAVALFVRTAVVYTVTARAGLEPGSRKIVAWFGPRGLSSLLLVLLPVFAGVPGAVELFAITSLVVIMSVAIHGGGIAWFLRRAAQRETAVVADAGADAPVASTRRRDSASRTVRKITVEEVRDMQRSGAPVTMVDARASRNLGADDSAAVAAVRIPPDDVARAARERGLTHHGTIVVYCA